MNIVEHEEAFKQILALQRQLLYSFERCTGMSASRMQLLAHLSILIKKIFIRQLQCPFSSN